VLSWFSLLGICCLFSGQQKSQTQNYQIYFDN